jgi:hypothetical protein
VQFPEKISLIAFQYGCNQQPGQGTAIVGDGLHNCVRFQVWGQKKGNIARFIAHMGAPDNALGYLDPTFPIWVEPGTDPGTQRLTV